MSGARDYSEGHVNYIVLLAVKVVEGHSGLEMIVIINGGIQK